MIARLLQKQIAEKLKPGLVVGLFGARRTGKTVIMEEIQKKKNRVCFWIHIQLLHFLLSTKKIFLILLVGNTIRNYSAGYSNILSTTNFREASPSTNL